MANTKQAIKMVRKIKRRTKQNKWWKLQVKDSVKALLENIKSGDEKSKKEALATLTKKVDKAAKTGALNRNKANRIKSRYQKASNALEVKPVAKTVTKAKAKAKKKKAK